MRARLFAGPHFRGGGLFQMCLMEAQHKQESDATSQAHAEEVAKMRSELEAAREGAEGYLWFRVAGAPPRKGA